MDKVTPGQNVGRSPINPGNRVPGAYTGGQLIEPDDLRGFDDGADAWMAGVNNSPKVPRSDPETYDYQVKRDGDWKPTNK